MNNEHDPLNVDTKVSLGFATLIENFQEKSLSLDNHLVGKAAATFFLREKGEAMLDTIKPKDLLIVDRSLSASHGQIVIVAWQGEFICRRFYANNDGIELRPDNDKFPIIKISSKEMEDFSIWGVVTYVIHSTT